MLQIIYTSCVQKRARKNTKYSRNETILKIGHHAKAIAHAKSSLWVKNEISKKLVKIHSTNHLELICEKSPCRKHQIFKKYDHFGLQPLENPYIGSNIKILNNMSKSVLQIIRNSSVKETDRKNTKYSRNETILKIGHYVEAIAHAKSSFWVKHVKIHSRNHLELFSAKNS